MSEERAMKIKHPKRERYASEVDYLIACLRFLDAAFPGREGQRKRIARFQRWESTPERLRTRLGELLLADGPLTGENRAEFDRLLAAWQALPDDVQQRINEERKRTT
jgi:hypothetical protein